MNRPLRIAAIHDLSGFGRCSLTVILPVLSAMGMQVCPVPTAVLSTHTGGMGEVVMRDLTDFLEPALDHYRRLELAFECIYTGFLGSPGADQPLPRLLPQLSPGAGRGGPGHGGSRQELPHRHR